MKWLAKLRWGELTRDYCEVCGVRLRVKQRVEIASIVADDLGGTAMIATFCKTDAPKESP